MTSLAASPEDLGGSTAAALGDQASHDRARNFAAGLDVEAGHQIVIESRVQGSCSRWTAVRFLIACDVMTASSSAPLITDGHPLDEVRYQRYSDLHKKARTLSEGFYKQLQLDASQGVLIGTTKTAMVYGLGTASVTNDE